LSRLDVRNYNVDEIRLVNSINPQGTAAKYGYYRSKNTYDTTAFYMCSEITMAAERAKLSNILIQDTGENHFRVDRPGEVSNQDSCTTKCQPNAGNYKKTLVREGSPPRTVNFSRTNR